MLEGIKVDDVDFAQLKIEGKLCLKSNCASQSLSGTDPLTCKCGRLITHTVMRKTDESVYYYATIEEEGYFDED